MNNKKIIIIGTIASSLYTFRKDLILSLLAKGYTVYAFTSDSNETELAKIAQLGAISTHYELICSGLNPYERLSNKISLQQKISARYCLWLFYQTCHIWDALCRNIQNYSLDVMVDNYISEYKKVLEKKNEA